MKNVVIIGSGPAGLTCAIYCARSGLKPVVLAGDLPGGQLINTDMIENFPGFESISGIDLMMKMISQSEAAGSEIVYEKAQEISKMKDGRFQLNLTSGDVLKSRAIVIATGSKHKHLEIPGEKEFANKGVSWCATCDGPMFRGKKVAVLGGGNTAVMEAIFLANFAEEVFLIHRRDSLRADKVMQEKLFENQKIKCIWNNEAIKISGNTVVREITIKNTVDGSLSDIKTDGIFVAIGTEACSSLVKDLVDLDPDGHIKAINTKTSCEGIFAIGDVVKDSLKQAIFSAGQGALAAKCVEEYLGVR